MSNPRDRFHFMYLDSVRYAKLPAHNRAIIDAFLHEHLGWPDRFPPIKSIHIATNQEVVHRIDVTFFSLDNPGDVKMLDLRREVVPTQSVVVRLREPFPVEALTLDTQTGLPIEVGRR